MAVLGVPNYTPAAFSTLRWARAAWLFSSIPALVVVAFAQEQTSATSTAANPPVILAETWARDSTELGRWLLGELNCVACHKAFETTATTIEPAPAPDLPRVFAQRLPGYVAQFLRTPASMRPGTRMPDLLAGLPPEARQERLVALEAFLRSLAEPTNPSPAEPSLLQVAQGRVLYHQVGCIACHPAFEAPAILFDSPPVRSDVEGQRTPDGGERIRAKLDLSWVGQAWSWDGLAGYLRDPRTLGEDSRMPSLNLTPDEAQAVAAYLLRVSSTGSRPTTRQAEYGPKSQRSMGPEGSQGMVPFSKSVVPLDEALSAIPDSRLALKGREYFSEMGCAACHAVLDDGSEIVTTLAAPSLADLMPNSTRGCLSANPSPGLPIYPLSRDQKSALRMALRPVYGEAPSRPKGHPSLARASADESKVHTLMAAFNCYACHRREGAGGAETHQTLYFRSLAEIDMGAEGRLPPALNGVGAKLKPEWLTRVLSEPHRPRPYLATRMPVFSKGHARRIAEAFMQGDRDAGERASPPTRVDTDVATGQWLVGQNGCACVTCHQLEGRPGLTMSALDLAWTSLRLERAWFLDYLADPAAKRPGARMPSFWPEGNSVFPNILDGSSNAQINAIWSYLQTLRIPGAQGIPGPQDLDQPSVGSRLD